VLPTLPFSALSAEAKGDRTVRGFHDEVVGREGRGSVLAPTAADTDLYQSGEIVAEVPMTGSSSRC